jgi:hypothetical protein
MKAVRDHFLTASDTQKSNVIKVASSHSSIHRKIRITAA